MNQEMKHGLNVVAALIDGYNDANHFVKRKNAHSDHAIQSAYELGQRILTDDVRKRIARWDVGKRRSKFPKSKVGRQIKQLARAVAVLRKLEAMS